MDKSKLFKNTRKKLLQFEMSRGNLLSKEQLDNLTEIIILKKKKIYLLKKEKISNE